MRRNMNAQQGMTDRNTRGKITDRITDRNGDPAGKELSRWVSLNLLSSNAVSLSCKNDCSDVSRGQPVDAPNCSSEIGADQVDEVLGYLLRGERGLARLHHVLADVIFQDLGHEAVDAAADVGDKHEDVGAIGVAAEGALDGIDLAAVASPASTYAGKLNLG
jgi:hypothetical protein